MTTCEQYYSLQQEYENIYGNDTVVMMQIGSFYEIFELNMCDEENIGKARYLSSKLGFTLTRRNKNREHSRTNPYLIGMPIKAFKVYKTLIMSIGFTIVLVEQDKNNSSNRSVTEIFSPTVCVDEEFNSAILSRNIMNIYFKGRNIGVSVINLLTGITSVFELYYDAGDEYCSLKDLYKSIVFYNPNMIIIDCEDIVYSEIFLIKHLNLERYNYNIRDTSIISNIFDDQVQLLSNIFDIPSLDVIDELSLQYYAFARTSYCLLLNYIIEQTPLVIVSPKMPIIVDMYEDQYLSLSYNAAEQLDIVDNPIHISTISLLDIVDNTNTMFGKRLLKNRLLRPYSNIETINVLHQNIEEMITDTNMLSDLENIFKNGSIPDVEYLHRRISMNVFIPKNIITMIDSHICMKNIIDCVRSSETIVLPHDDILDNFNSSISELTNIFNIEQMRNINTNWYDANFFNYGVNADIDDLQFEIDEYMSEIVCLHHKFNELILTKNLSLCVKHDNRDGHYIHATSIQYRKIENILSETEEYEVNTKFKKKVKIYPIGIKHISGKLLPLVNTMKSTLKSRFKETIISHWIKYNVDIEIVTEFIAEIDVLISNAISATKYNYNKPEIIDNDEGFINCTELRHPIVERILENEGEQYISNDIELNGGILLYSPNSCGKSVLTKSIALNVIMAQAGMYVAADNFTLSPFSKIITRITSHDNMFKGQSSFIIEMDEICNMLKQSDNKSLIIGDELCRGTESSSALALISVCMSDMIRKGAKFVISSHLHELVNIDEVKEMIEQQNIKVYHLEVIYKDNSLVYDRKIRKGQGPCKYGLEIASFVGFPKDLIENALSIRDRYDL